MEKVLRIGEVSRRTGVTVETLRAWERRYGVLDPDRTEGGHRLYGDRDVGRVEAMQRLLDDGWSAAAAAREVLRHPAMPGAVRPLSGAHPIEELRARLNDAFTAYDAGAADAVLDDVFARLDVPAALDEVILPVIRHLGDGWEDDPQIIAREHFASNAIRPRLMRLLGRSHGLRNRVILAAAPEHEEHDLGLLAASVAAADGGWTVHFLGYRTPTTAIARAGETSQPNVLLLGAVRREAGMQVLGELNGLAPAIVMGGAGFRPEDVEGHPSWLLHTGSMRDLRQTLEAALAAAAESDRSR